LVSVPGRARTAAAAAVSGGATGANIVMLRPA
jgi:hypothetical protein